MTTKKVGKAAVKKRPFRFHFHMSGDEERKTILFEKLGEVKNLSAKCKNIDAIEAALDFWIQHHSQIDLDSDEKEIMETDERGNLSFCSNSETSMPVIVTTYLSINNLLKIGAEHNVECKFPLLVTANSVIKGHHIACELRCRKNHFRTWNTSPILPNGEAYVNSRLGGSALLSGMLDVQYQRFCENAGIGALCKVSYAKLRKQFIQPVKEEKEASCRNALHEEIASYEELDGITILSDARHAVRKNSPHTDVICIGQNTKKVIAHEHITRADDPSTQRHELFGTKNLYKEFDSLDVPIKIHCHDRNGSVNKFIIEEREDTINQNDTWHAIKALGKKLQEISRGALYKHGITWHDELEDKVQGVKNHVHYAIRNCEENADNLRGSMDNTIQHYKNNHSSCAPESRCKQAGYEPSKKRITSARAERLLRNVIQQSSLYSNAEDYVLALGTDQVESFNNTLNVFQDKRVGGMSAENYRMRSHLAICYWNNRKEKESTAPHDVSNYTTNIWDRYFDKMYEN